MQKVGRIMPYLGNIIDGLAWIIGSVLNIYFWVVIISALLTFVNPDPYNPIVKFLRNVTQPAFESVRRFFPFVIIGGMDLSPVVVLLAIQFLSFAIVKNLKYFAVWLIG
jgi:YggT family protein